MLLDGNNDPKAAKIPKRILKAEEMKRMFQKLQSYLSPNQHSSLSHVMVPTDGRPPKQATERKPVSDTEEVETTILEKNQKHFGQGQGTPFTKGRLGNIPFNGTGPIADSILNGTERSSNRVKQLVLDELKKQEGKPDRHK
mgnify:CR=1 FL=1